MCLCKLKHCCLRHLYLRRSNWRKHVEKICTQHYCADKCRVSAVRCVHSTEALACFVSSKLICLPTEKNKTLKTQWFNRRSTSLSCSYAQPCSTSGTNNVWYQHDDHFCIMHILLHFFNHAAVHLLCSCRCVQITSIKMMTFSLLHVFLWKHETYPQCL